jgi:transposase
MSQLRIARRGKGRPRTRPAAAMGDKAYSSAASRACLRKRGIKAVIPVKEDQKNHRRRRGSAGGRPPGFDPKQDRDRNTVERCFSKLKQYRAVATRSKRRSSRVVTERMRSQLVSSDPQLVAPAQLIGAVGDQQQGPDRSQGPGRKAMSSRVD